MFSLAPERPTNWRAGRATRGGKVCLRLTNSARRMKYICIEAASERVDLRLVSQMAARSERRGVWERERERERRATLAESCCHSTDWLRSNSRRRTLSSFGGGGGGGGRKRARAPLISCQMGASFGRFIELFGRLARKFASWPSLRERRRPPFAGKLARLVAFSLAVTPSEREREREREAAPLPLREVAIIQSSLWRLHSRARPAGRFRRGAQIDSRPFQSMIHVALLVSFILAPRLRAFWQASGRQRLEWSLSSGARQDVQGQGGWNIGARVALRLAGGCHLPTILMLIDDTVGPAPVCCCCCSLGSTCAWPFKVSPAPGRSASRQAGPAADSNSRRCCCIVANDD